VNLAQIRSAVPKLFRTQQSQTAPKQNLTQFTECGKNMPFQSNDCEMNNVMDGFYF